MEIINFLFFIFLVYNFIYTSILMKLFIFLFSCLSVSVYREIFENPRPDTELNNKIILSIYKIIYDTGHKLFNIFDKLKKYKIFIIIYNLISYFNYLFITGRNDLYYLLINKCSNVFIPKKKQVKIIENNKTDQVFKDDDDMMDFLDDLVNKKK